MVADVDAVGEARALAVAAELSGVDPSACANCEHDERWVLVYSSTRPHGRGGPRRDVGRCYGNKSFAHVFDQCPCEDYAPYGGVE